ncbi:uncharacterized protein LOC135834675 [Planococcus citri]|uniref:uncharacterized protein LOC135834675 n=1 Tax=Planococcus citri TaxID=170843 RepID=UPI0031FA00EA
MPKPKRKDSSDYDPATDSSSSSDSDTSDTSSNTDQESDSGIGTKNSSTTTNASINISTISRTDSCSNLSTTSSSKSIISRTGSSLNLSTPSLSKSIISRTDSSSNLSTTSSSNTSTATETSRGSRVRENRDSWLKNIKRNIRNSKDSRVGPHIACDHVDLTWCEADKLTTADIDAFHASLYENVTYGDQNKFITPYLVTCPGVRQRTESETPRKKIVTQYLVRTLDCKVLVVCAKTFRSITGLTRGRLNGVSKHFFTTGNSKPEQRGGSRITPQQIEITESIVEFIKKFKVEESHYGRGKSAREYLPPELNVSIMFNMWLNERNACDLPIASLKKFTKVFKKRFNLAFLSPKVGVCSHCEQLKGKLKSNINVEENRALLDLHKAQAKQFYDILRESAAEDSTLTITFDMQQVQPLPKTNIGEAYYSRQLGLYNLTFVIHTSNETPLSNVHIYTWTDTDSGKGSNEVVSAFDHFFEKIIHPRIANGRYNKIQLFSDCCPAQNKNTTMLGYLMRKIEDPVMKKIAKVEYIFPIRGHSYLPADRVFARIEKKLRKIAVLKSPSDYHSVFEEHGKYHVFGDDWRVYDYKTLAETSLKSTAQLQMQQNRRWLFCRRKPGVIQVSNSYTEPYKEFSMLKPAITKLFPRKPELVTNPKGISTSKRDDVRKLIALMDLSEMEKQYYETELSKPCSTKKDVLKRAKEKPAKSRTSTKRKIDSDDDNLRENIPKPRRGRPKKNVVVENVMSEPSTSAEIEKPKRGRPKKDATVEIVNSGSSKEDLIEKPKRGRPKKDAPVEIVNSGLSNEDLIEKPKRGRPKKVDEQPKQDELDKPKRGRPKKL